MVLVCNSCKRNTHLTCKVPVHIYRYRPNIECPNPLCNKLGHDGQKGWIYKLEYSTSDSKCHFCGVTFKFDSTDSSSWVGSQIENQLLAFCFDDDIWDLRHFYDKSPCPTINFQKINPQWYRVKVKKYLLYLLQSQKFSSASRVIEKIVSLRQLGMIIDKQYLKNQSSINIDLEASSLIRSRDFLKVSKNDADWLDEVTRKAIKQELSKIPAPIARHYLVQEYIAARPGDVCQITFDCLVEENGKWYIKFLQQKTERWHKILASRKIRTVIEEQQQWIRETLGAEYPYLFCYFRIIRATSYPNFPNIKPLPEPPKTSAQNNPMVRIIRMLIKNEDIRDANGQQPHFTGRITRSSRLQEVRTKYGIEAARLYADHQSSNTTFQHYAPPTREQVAKVDLPFQKLLLNPDDKFLPWQSLPESLLKNPKVHELDLEIAPRLVVYGHCALDPKTPCPVNLFPKCYGCSSFRPSTGKLPLYERQYRGEQQRLTEAETAGAELAHEEAKATIEAMDKWLPELRRLANG